MLSSIMEIDQKLIYSGNNYNLKLSVKAANCVLDDERFFKELEQIDEFDMSRFDSNNPVSGKKLIKMLRSNKVIGNVIVYRPRWCFSKAYGYYSGGKDIYLNERKLIRNKDENVNIASLAGSLVHEYIHMLDNFVSAYLGHGDNSPVGKEKTTPYMVGRMAKKFVFKNYLT